MRGARGSGEQTGRWLCLLKTGSAGPGTADGSAVAPPQDVSARSRRNAHKKYQHCCPVVSRAKHWVSGADLSPCCIARKLSLQAAGGHPCRATAKGGAPAPLYRRQSHPQKRWAKPGPRPQGAAPAPPRFSLMSACPTAACLTAACRAVICRAAAVKITLARRLARVSPPGRTCSALPGCLRGRRSL